MSKDMEIKIGSTIYGRINAMNMSPAEREVALNAMLNAEMLMDALLWVKTKLEQLGALLVLKPGIKH